jgi:DNA-binding MarR family transcriptional regulator
MNENLPSVEELGSVSEEQVVRLHVLIEEVRRCCEDRRLFEAAEVGLPYAEIRCLMLFGDERYLTVKGISGRLEVAKSRVTNIVNSINKKGLVERAPDPADGRVRLLRLTAKGRRIVEKIRIFQKCMEEKILQKLDPADRSRVISGLELLRAAMKEAKAEMQGGAGPDLSEPEKREEG